MDGFLKFFQYDKTGFQELIPVQRVSLCIRMQGLNYIDKDLSFNTKNICFHLGTTLEENFKRKQKNYWLQNVKF
jgi:hypothetical protein